MTIKQKHQISKYFTTAKVVELVYVNFKARLRSVYKYVSTDETCKISIC